jgi:hypothetical protein
MSAHSGLPFEVRALQRELQAFDLGVGAEAFDAVLALVRAARRMSRLAQELAAEPSRAGAARDEVSFARVADACLAGEGAPVEPGDLEAAIALIAKRATVAGNGDASGQTNRVQRTLAAVTNLPGVSGE